MDQHSNEPTREAVPAEPKSQWTAPQVDRFIAGGAEGSAGSSIEGLDGLS